MPHVVAKDRKFLDQQSANLALIIQEVPTIELNVSLNFVR